MVKHDWRQASNMVRGNELDVEKIFSEYDGFLYLEYGYISESIKAI